MTVLTKSINQIWYNNWRNWTCRPGDRFLWVFCQDLWWIPAGLKLVGAEAW